MNSTLQASFITSSIHLSPGRRYRVMKEGQQVFTCMRYRQVGGSQVTLMIQNNAFLDVLILNRTQEAQGCFCTNTVRFDNQGVTACIYLNKWWRNNTCPHFVIASSGQRGVPISTGCDRGKEWRLDMAGERKWGGKGGELGVHIHYHILFSIKSIIMTKNIYDFHFPTALRGMFPTCQHSGCSARRGDGIHCPQPIWRSSLSYHTWTSQVQEKARLPGES